jgi:hypothetical protein
MGNIPLTTSEQKDVISINRAMRRLEKRGILFFGMDDEILMVRGDMENSYVEPSGCMPLQNAIIGRLECVCQCGGW